jgi:hypothetical protein
VSFRMFVRQTLAVLFQGDLENPDLLEFSKTLIDPGKF